MVHPFCSGTTTWYAAGEKRWASITDNTTSLTINAWTPLDTCQAIQQHYLKDDTIKAVSKQTLEVSRQQGDVDNNGTPQRGFRYLEKICICIPSTGMSENSYGFIDLWGDPADQLLSPQVWLQLLIEMTHKCKIRAEKLEMRWDRSCSISVKGLLNILLLEDTQCQLKQLLMEREGGWRDVRVHINDDNISELDEWSGQYQRQQSLIGVGLVTCG